MLYKLVKLVHIDIHEKLGGEIAKGQTFPPVHRRKAINHFRKEPHDILIGNILAEDVLQGIMINILKESLNVALENPAGAGVISAHPVSQPSKPVYGFMRSLSESTRVRVRNKSPVKERVENPINCVVQ